LPRGERGIEASLRSSAVVCTRPDWAGNRCSCSPVVISAPNRLPPLPVRCAIAATAAMTRSRFSHRAVPKSRLGDRSITAQVSSSRSAIVSRMCGTVVRAVTAQSIRRTSSPG
jgi:hypothetical protein